MILHKNLPMSIESLIEVVRLRGLRLNNLFQLPEPHLDVWQANVTDGHKIWEFGRGATPEEALRAALHVAATTEPQYSPPPPIKVLWKETKTQTPLNRIPPTAI
jgi:hypothetical protein